MSTDCVVEAGDLRRRGSRDLGRVLLLLVLVVPACTEERSESVPDTSHPQDTDACDGTRHDADGSDPPAPGTLDCAWVAPLDRGPYWHTGLNLANQAALSEFHRSGCDTIEGDVYFVDSSATALPRLYAREVTGTVTVGQNPNLTALDGLADLESAGTLHIGGRAHPSGGSRNLFDGNASLVSLQGLQSFHTGAIVVSDNMRLRTLDGAGPLGWVGGIGIGRNPALVDISAFHGAGAVEVFVFENRCLSSDRVAAFVSSLSGPFSSVPETRDNADGELPDECVLTE